MRLIQTQSKIQSSVFLILQKLMTRDGNQSLTFDFVANSSKLFMNPVEIPWKFKKSALFPRLSEKRKPGENCYSFWSKWNRQKYRLKPMKLRMFSTDLTGNTAGVLGQPKHENS